MIDHQIKVADAAVAVSTAGAVTAWVVDALPYVQLGAGLVAIIAGLFAIRYHHKNTKGLPGG